MNKLQELRLSIKSRGDELSRDDISKISLGETKRPLWMEIIENSEMMGRSKGRGNRSLLRPMPESDEVIGFLLSLKEKVHTTIKENINGADHDTIDTPEQEERISFNVESKEVFISSLLGMIEDRAIPKKTAGTFNFDGIEHGTLEELYNYIHKLSTKLSTDQDIKNFIIDEIPVYDNDEGLM